MYYPKPTNGLQEAVDSPFCLWTLRFALSGTGDSQRDSRESIRANHSQLKPLFL